MPQTKPIPDADKTSEDWEALPDVVVLNISFVTAVVCAKNGVTDKEIERVLNREHGTGIDSPWRIDKEVESQPCKDGRPDATHYQLCC